MFPTDAFVANWVTLPLMLSAPFRVAWYVLAALYLLKNLEK
jgi:hypothetical protein